MASSTDQIQASSETEECAFAMVLSSACAFPMTLKAAIELDVLEIIAKAGPGAHLSPAEIAAHITTKNTAAPIMLDRMLRLLACYSVVACTHRALENGQLERVYGLAPVCKFLVRNEEGASMAPLLELIHDKVLLETWYHLKDAVVDGGVPFDRALGMNAFEYARVDARFDKVFSRGMLNHSTVIMNKIIETYTGFQELNSLVDVGGGLGVTLNKIVRKYPRIKGINFDLPHVIAHAPAHSGVELVAGDMFASVPSGEAILMKWILHDWGEEECWRLLKNCYNALPKNGKVIVVEYILPLVPNTSKSSCSIFQLDLLMFAYCPRGKERTEEEYLKLARGAGFTRMKKACTVYDMSVLEFYKM